MSFNNGSNNNNSTVSSTAYQSIIITLIAAGVLSIGFLSLIWRRRRIIEMRRVLANSRAMRERIAANGGVEGWEEDDPGLPGGGGTMVGGKGGKGRWRGVPEFWYAEIVAEKGEEGDLLEKGSDEESVINHMDGMNGSAKMAVDGDVSESWRPANLSLSAPEKYLSTKERPRQIPPPSSPSGSASSSSSISAEITLLIAMPSPTSHRLSITQNSIYDDNEEEEPLPLVELGATSIPLGSTDLESQKEILGWIESSGMKKPADIARQAERRSADLERRFVRTDGFRSGRPYP